MPTLDTSRTVEQKAREFRELKRIEQARADQRKKSELAQNRSFPNVSPVQANLPER
ncbi:MAG: hypothetical protein KF774_10650 [Planctomyces sp.]|nr:hypothetical protein [Planctomyces sp.]